MKKTKTHRYFLSALRLHFRNKFDSQKALAYSAKVSKSVISDIFKGKRPGSVETQQKIAEAFGFDLVNFYEEGRRISEEEVFGGEEETTGWEIKEKPEKGSNSKCRKLEQLPHDEIINRFKDKEAARRLNMMLVELEDKDPDMYFQAEVYISALYDTLKLKKTAND